MRIPHPKRDERIRARYIELHKKHGIQESALYELYLEELHVSGLGIDRLKQICTIKSKLNQKNAKIWIYVITDGTYCKIGKSLNVQSRLRELQTASARPLSLVFAGESRSFVEQKIHTKFRGKRQNGEWFVLSPQDVETVKNMIKQGLGAE